MVECDLIYVLLLCGSSDNAFLFLAALCYSRNLRRATKIDGSGNGSDMLVALCFVLLLSPHLRSFLASRVYLPLDWLAGEARHQNGLMMGRRVSWFWPGLANASGRVFQACVLYYMYFVPNQRCNYMAARLADWWRCLP